MSRAIRFVRCHAKAFDWLGYLLTIALIDLLIIAIIAPESAFA